MYFVCSSRDISNRCKFCFFSFRGFFSPPTDKHLHRNIILRVALKKKKNKQIEKKEWYKKKIRHPFHILLVCHWIFLTGVNFFFVLFFLLRTNIYLYLLTYILLRELKEKKKKNKYKKERRKKNKRSILHFVCSSLDISNRCSFFSFLYRQEFT